MKATVDPSIMKKVLKSISPVISKNVVLPVLECIKMDFKDNQLTITGTNLNTEISVVTQCEAPKDFSLIMSADTLLDICDKAEGSLLIEQKKDSIKVSHNRAKFNLPIYGEPEIFPKMGTDDYFITFNAEGDFFYSLNGANECGAKGHNLSEAQIQNCVIDFKESGITIFATDRSVVYKKDIPIACNKKTSAHLGTHFASLTKSFQSSEVSVGEKFISATYGNISVTSRLSESMYVDYSVILPKKPVVFNVLVSRVDIIKSIQILGVSADKRNGDIIFKFRQNEIVLEAYDSNYGISGETFMPASHNIDDTMEPIRLSGSRLISLLSTIIDENVKMSFEDPKSFVYIQPEEDQNTLLYIAPLAII